MIPPWTDAQPRSTARQRQSTTENGHAHGHAAANVQAVHGRKQSYGEKARTRCESTGGDEQGGAHGPQHELEYVVERRLRRLTAEQNAMRAVVLRRLKEKEAALEFAIAKAISHDSSNKASSRANLFLNGGHTADDASTVNADNEPHTLSPSNSIDGAARSSSHRSPDGPWEASMRSHPKLEHVRRMRRMELETTKRMELQRLKERRKSSMKYERAVRAQRHQKSMNLKAHFLASKEERYHRKMAIRAATEKKIQRMAVRMKRSEDNVVSTKAARARIQRRKARLRARRSAEVCKRREERICADNMKKMAMIERMNKVMREAQARLTETNSKIRASTYEDRRERVKMHEKDSILASAEELAAKEAHQHEVMTRCQEMRRQKVAKLVRKNKKRYARANRERVKLEKALVLHKTKLVEDKQKRFEAITSKGRANSTR